MKVVVQELHWIGLHEGDAVKAAGTPTKNIACLFGSNYFQVPISRYIGLFFFPVAEGHDESDEGRHAGGKHTYLSIDRGRPALSIKEGFGTDEGLEVTTKRVLLKL